MGYDMTQVSPDETAATTRTERLRTLLHDLEHGKYASSSYHPSAAHKRSKEEVSSSDDESEQPPLKRLKQEMPAITHDSPEQTQLLEKIRGRMDDIAMDNLVNEIFPQMDPLDLESLAQSSKRYLQAFQQYYHTSLLEKANASLKDPNASSTPEEIVMHEEHVFANLWKVFFSATDDEEKIGMWWKRYQKNWKGITPGIDHFWRRDTWIPVQITQARFTLYHLCEALIESKFFLSRLYAEESEGVLFKLLWFHDMVATNFSDTRPWQTEVQFVIKGKVMTPLGESPTHRLLVQRYLQKVFKRFFIVLLHKHHPKSREAEFLLRMFLVFTLPVTLNDVEYTSRNSDVEDLYTKIAYAAIVDPFSKDTWKQLQSPAFSFLKTQGKSIKNVNDAFISYKEISDREDDPIYTHFEAHMKNLRETPLDFIYSVPDNQNNYKTFRVLGKNVWDVRERDLSEVLIDAAASMHPVTWRALPAKPIADGAVSRLSGFFIGQYRDPEHFDPDVITDEIPLYQAQAVNAMYYAAQKVLGQKKVSLQIGRGFPEWWSPPTLWLKTQSSLGSWALVPSHYVNNTWMRDFWNPRKSMLSLLGLGATIYLSNTRGENATVLSPEMVESPIIPQGGLAQEMDETPIITFEED